MASLPGNIILSTAIMPNKKSRFCTSLQVRAQSHGDEAAGRSSNIVDANLHLLKVRIEEVKNKERLERCRQAEPGWNYASAESSYKAKREREFLQFLQLVGIGGGALGLTILTCTFCLCITSLILHLNQ